MAKADLDLVARRAALVGELGQGAPQIMRRDLAQPGKVTIADDGLKDGPSRDQSVADEAALETGRSTVPESMPAAVAHSSSAAKAQDGIGTVRTLPCLPTRSTIAQRLSAARRRGIPARRASHSAIHTPPTTPIKPDPVAATCSLT